MAPLGKHYKVTVLQTAPLCKQYVEVKYKLRAIETKCNKWHHYGKNQPVLTRLHVHTYNVENKTKVYQTAPLCNN